MPAWIGGTGRALEVAWCAAATFVEGTTVDTGTAGAAGEVT